MSEQQTTTSPLVGLVMGSDSDWPVMQLATKVLDDFDIAYEVDVVSAHRMPDEMITYGLDAEERGLRVIVLTGYPGSGTPLDKANAVLQKPYDAQELLATMRDVMQARA